MRKPDPDEDVADASGSEVSASEESVPALKSRQARERHLRGLEAATVKHRREAMQQVHARLGKLRHAEEGRRETEDAYTALWEAGREEREWVEAMWKEEEALYLQLIAAYEGSLRESALQREEQQRSLTAVQAQQLREEWRDRKEAQQVALAQRLRAVERQSAQRQTHLQHVQNVQRRELEDRCHWATYKAITRRQVEQRWRLHSADVDGKRQQRAARTRQLLGQERQRLDWLSQSVGKTEDRRAWAAEEQQTRERFEAAQRSWMAWEQRLTASLLNLPLTPLAKSSTTSSPGPGVDRLLALQDSCEPRATSWQSHERGCQTDSRGPTKTVIAATDRVQAADRQRTFCSAMREASRLLSAAPNGAAPRSPAPAPLTAPHRPVTSHTGSPTTCHQGFRSAWDASPPTAQVAGPQPVADSTDPFSPPGVTPVDPPALRYSLAGVLPP
eukprot:GGOE01042078.1.p1 GENE.GGOE01042078.1~~GGOE01042078.1.p1  ORF type:complete len:445 (-),score=96.81 GGOE01042078.1:217-1551(-)